MCAEASSAGCLCAFRKKGDSFLGLTADESDVLAGRLKGLDAYLCRMPAADLRLIGDMHGNGRDKRGLKLGVPSLRDGTKESNRKAL